MCVCVCLSGCMVLCISVCVCLSVYLSVCMILCRGVCVCVLISPLVCAGVFEPLLVAQKLVQD